MNSNKDDSEFKILKEKVEFYEKVFEKCPVVIYINDIIKLQPGWRSKKEYLGYDKEFLENRNVDSFNEIYPEKYKSLALDTKKFVEESPDGVTSLVYEVLDKNGNPRTIYGLGSVFEFDEMGNVAKIIGVSFDATDRVFNDEPFEKLLKENNQLKNQIKINMLTKRELEIIKLFAKGFAQKEIAEQLKISLNTVNNHRKNMLKKFKFNKITELVNFAMNAGLF